MAAPNHAPSVTAPHVLVVEDDPRSLELTSAYLAEGGVAVVGATSVEQGLDVVRARTPDLALVITDVKLGAGSGLDLFRTLRVERPDLPVILVTAYGRTDEAVAAMREGALYYFTKPVDFPLLSRLVRETLEKQSLRAEVAHLHARLYGSSNPPILGSSRVIQVALEHAATVAALDTTVILRGETGTGKELFARFIHERSARRGGPLVAVNCAALPEPLLESELFGHERGAFTGAVARKPGRLELANGGTLFLDEVADMPLALQAKLLRAFEARQIEPLGSTRPVAIDVRVIAATNRNLDTAVRDGMFREDLFYRLQVFPIALPSLRERPQDIPILAAFFLEEFGRAFSKPGISFEPETLDALQSYSWPGNVRELRHAVERAVILAKGPAIKVAHLPAPITSGSRSGTGPRLNGSATLADLQRQAILSALEDAGGNQSKAARALGLSRNQIQYWIRTKLKQP